VDKFSEDKIATDFPLFQHLDVENKNRHHILGEEFWKFFSARFTGISGIFFA